MDKLKIEFTIARQDNAFELGIIEKGELTAFTCPDCHGALTKLIEGNLIRFRYVGKQHSCLNDQATPIQVLR